MRSSNIWHPDPRTEQTIGDVALIYLAGETEGAYRITDASRTVVVYPAKAMTTAMRGRIIRRQLADPDPVAAAVGALVLGGLRPGEYEQTISESD